MEIVKGSVVKALTGRDSEKEGAYYAVTAIEEGYILICDGKRRPLERPKKKNPRHLKTMDDILREEEMRSNRALRRALREYAERRSAEN